jgi:hypothetical protein
MDTQQLGMCLKRKELQGEEVEKLTINHQGVGVFAADPYDHKFYVFPYFLVVFEVYILNVPTFKETNLVIFVRTQNPQTKLLNNTIV